MCLNIAYGEKKPSTNWGHLIYIYLGIITSSGQFMEYHGSKKCNNNNCIFTFGD